MKTPWIVIVAGAACSNDGTACERLGQCVSVGTGGVAVSVPPPLEPVQMFQPPVADALAISSTFGPRWRFSESVDEFHLGIDYYGTLGTPLRAIGPGRVSAVRPAGSAEYPNGGNVVVIEHAIPPRMFHDQTVDRFYAVYLHADTFAVAEGDTVTTGQQVATMGMTGDTDFVHLHFETRVQTVCSLAYQNDHPTSSCVTGFDPHVHPYLFVGGDNADTIRVEELASDDYAVHYIATRGDLDLDVIETDLGTISFDTREGDGLDVFNLDDFDYGWMRLVPREFVSTSATLELDLHFPKQPAYLEVRDIYGRGLHYGNPIH